MNQLNPEKLEALLKFAAAKLNMPVEQLAATVSSGGAQALASTLSDSNKAKLNALLADRKQLDALLQNEQVRALLKRYST